MSSIMNFLFDWIFQTNGQLKEMQLAETRYKSYFKDPAELFTDQVVRQRKFKGRITTINESQSYGLINENIYYDTNKFAGFEFNDEVFGIAIKDTDKPEAGWTAYEIGRVKDCWDFDEQQYESTQEDIRQISVRNGPRNEKGYSTYDDKFVIPGERVWLPSMFSKFRLKDYNVPIVIVKALEQNINVANVMNVLKDELTPKNYIKKFSCLLHVEDATNQMSMKQFDMHNVPFIPSGEFISIVVPGLGERRPSLIVGDKIFANEAHSNRYYEGFIHVIRQNDILVKFNRLFHHDYNGQVFNVSFVHNRVPSRRCQLGLETTKHYADGEILFPTNISPKTELVNVSPETVNWVNRKLNDRQKLAVLNIMRGKCRPTPYLIFGPPGTGKTVTVVEAIIQVFQRVPNSRIIASTNSNACSNLIAIKLVESGCIKEKDMVRLIAHHRIETVPEELKSFARNSSEGEEGTWLNHRIIVSTCINAATIHHHMFPTNHFTHAFIDESTQASEPESLIPIGFAAMAQGMIVIAGDPYQLGPVCMSLASGTYGLATPFMNRLFEMKLYEIDHDKFGPYGGYNPNIITKLLINYRSDARITHVSNGLFYNNELIGQVPPDRMLLEKMELKFPILFHGLAGCDLREYDNPSWFNPSEALQACVYLRKLYNIGIEPDEIGVITPYRKQVEKIRLLMNSLELEMCKVASVEEFQGDERRVIIISTVRASSEFIEMDLKYHLGFVFSPKRFNVAVTRAMSLLIVLGDPVLLARDESWAPFLKYCCDNGAYIGREFDAAVNDQLQGDSCNNNVL